MKVGSLEIELLANLARLQTDMDATKKMVGGAMSSVSDSVMKAKGALMGLAGAGIALAFAASIQGAIDQADALNKLSQRTGVATETLSQLQYAAKLADVSNESLTKGLKKLNVSIAEGLAGEKSKVAIFKELGITLTDTQGRAKTADMVLLDLADTFAKSKDGAGKTALAVDLLGKAGDEMIPLLNGGRQAILDLMLEADKLGLTISGEFAKNAEEFNDNLTRIQVSSQKLAIALGSDLVRGLGQSMKAFADATIEGGKLAGMIAFIQTLLTGDDRYKNDKKMVELTEEKLKLESSLEKMQAAGDKRPLVLAAQKKALAEVNAELKTTMSYRGVLAEQEDKAAAAAKKLETARTGGRELKKPNSAGNSAAEAAEKDAMEARIQAYKNSDKAVVDGRTDFFNELAFQIKLGNKTAIQAVEEGLAQEERVWSQRQALLQAELDLVKQKKNSLKEQETLAGKMGDIERDRDQARKKAAGEISVILREQARAYAEAEAAAQEYIDTVNKQYARELDGQGRGAAYRERSAGIAQIEDRYSQARDRLESDRRRGAFDSNPQRYSEELDRINRFQSTALESYKKYYDNRRDGEESYYAGANEAISNYLETNRNVAKQTEDLFTRALSGMEDALVSFVKTGKLDFASLADAIISDIIRMQARAALSSLFGQGGGFGGGILDMIMGKGGISGQTVGMSGDGVVGAIGDLVSMSGGGYTGDGARTGGVDGQGGFLSILHPQETVTDHAKGGAGGASPISVSVVIHSDGSVSANASSGQEFGRKIGSAVKAIIVEEKMPGGLLYAPA